MPRLVQNLKCWRAEVGEVEDSYGQFCTVARGAEALCERWTPLVIRELLCGSKRFNELHRGVPRMSTSLLAQRLRHLEEIGVIRREAAGKVWKYHLTEAGEELRPVITALGQWGARWIGSRLRDDELDAGLLMWDIRRFVHLELFPAQPVIIQFDLHDARPGERHWWLVVEAGIADLCRDDPGQVPTLLMRSSVRTLTEIWTGDRDAQDALHNDDVQVAGQALFARQLWAWLGTSAFAPLRRAHRGSTS